MDDPVGDHQGHRGRGERELVGHPVPYFQVARDGPGGKQRDLDGSDQFAVYKVVLDVRTLRCQEVEVPQQDPPFARGALDAHHGVECHQGDGEVRGVQGDAPLVRAEDGVHTGHPLDGRTTGPGEALVALRDVGVPEVPAARPLQQVSADRRHVPQLGGRALQQRLPDQGQALGDCRIGRQFLHRRQGADVERLAPPLGTGQWETRDVDQHARAEHPVLHQIELRRPSGQIRGVGTGRDQSHRVGDFRRPDILK